MWKLGKKNADVLFTKYPLDLPMETSGNAYNYRVVDEGTTFSSNSDFGGRIGVFYDPDTGIETIFAAVS